MNEPTPTYDEMFPLLEPTLSPSPQGDDLCDVEIGPEDVESWRLAIRCGEKKRAPTLVPDIGATHLVRFLRFGKSNSPLALVNRHRVCRSKSLVCPRHTSSDLGGNKSAPCPLCDLESDPSSLEQDWLIPQHFKSAFAFVIRIGGIEDGKHIFIPEFNLRKPHQLWLPFEAAAPLVRKFKDSLFNSGYERGTVFAMKIRSKDDWHLTPFMSGAVFPTLPANEITRRIAWIEGHLVEPDVKIATLEELEQAKRLLFAYRDAPERNDDRFWDQMMAASLPDLQLPPLVPTAQRTNLPRRPSKPMR
jgi:hypothetical protein